jgi:hypothetical protein
MHLEHETVETLVINTDMCTLSAVKPTWHRPPVICSQCISEASISKTKPGFGAIRLRVSSNDALDPKDTCVKRCKYGHLFDVACMNGCSGRENLIIGSKMPNDFRF